MVKYAIAFTIVLALPAYAQHSHEASADSSRMIGAADESMAGPPSANAAKHLELSPTRAGTKADSAKAREIVTQLRAALAKYTDTSAAVADGFKLFAPRLKEQRVYHFTNYRNAFLEAFRFDASRPTSILYQRGADGRLHLLGAMYTAPKRVRAGRLDERVPLSIARWHRHVNWCLPRKGEESRWTERRNGAPLFGPESPIVTREACEGVGGRFYPNLFGWMIHANVFAGDDLASVFAHEH